eukprot:TRINITY_DN10374_c0_g1_i1.p1 TRINITY_DN10374_c0_g1~~TRINITY_DN10374_c0_g1_i1.p1  ORF type:complete len:255 (+),score=29.65 TRINITY_DN10374_c0_g1_i1:278-1042(+)
MVVYGSQAAVATCTMYGTLIVSACRHFSRTTRCGQLCEALVESSGNTVACATADYSYSQDLGGCCQDNCTTAAYKLQLAQVQAAFQVVDEWQGIDPQRVTFGGHSAGAHLAWMLALAYPDSWYEPVAVIGLEGVYNVSMWASYDHTRWHDQFHCATIKAFGSPSACPTCWINGSATHLARQGDFKMFGFLIHSPEDDWVQASQTSQLHAIMAEVYPDAPVKMDVDGRCAKGQHEDMLHGDSARMLARCILQPWT